MKTKIALFSFFVLIPSLSLAHVKINYGFSTFQNKRPYQEDRFMYANINKGEFFGVYDGHGGDKTSSFLKNNLHTYFVKAQGTIQDKFIRAFEQADYMCQNSWQDGSTVVVMYIDNNNVLHCAWAGDSRLVLESSDKVAFASDDHKPDREDEKKRIEKAGGKVVMHGVWRVNGLAVSRSIGDVGCKEAGIGQIIATPEYAQKQLTTSNHFAIIASDGLWDVISSKRAVAIVAKALHEEKSLNDIARILQNVAIKRGSGDNITICITQFDWTPVSTARKWWNWVWGK